MNIKKSVAIDGTATMKEGGVKKPSKWNCIKYKISVKDIVCNALKDAWKAFRKFLSICIMIGIAYLLLEQPEISNPFFQEFFEGCSIWAEFMFKSIFELIGSIFNGNVFETIGNMFSKLVELTTQLIGWMKAL